MKSNAILRDFVGTICSACGRTKQKNNGFCVRCYRSLPPQMQHALWRRFGSGFEEAFDAASQYLSEANARKSQGRLPLDA